MAYFNKKRSKAKAKASKETKQIEQQTVHTISDQTRSNDKLSEIILGGRPDNDGISSDPLNVPAYFNAIRQVASAIARTDLWCKKIGANGSKTPDKDHSAYWICSWKANPLMNYFDWLRTLVGNAIHYSEAFSFIDRDEISGDILGTYIQDSTKVYPVPIYENGRLVQLTYGVTTVDDRGNSLEVIVPAEDMVHIKSMSLGAGDALDALSNFRNTYKKANAITKFQYLYFKNGSHISKVCKVPGWLTDEQKAQVQSSLSALNEGMDNSHRMALLQGGTDLVSLPLNAQEMELVASGEGTLTDIANSVGCPGTRIGARGSISYGSLEQDNLLFAQDLDNWYTNIEAELTIKFLKPRQQGTTHVIEFDRGSFFASDPGYQRLQMEKYNNNIITLQECRNKIGETTEPEGDFKADIEAAKTLADQTAAAATDSTAEPDKADPEANQTESVDGERSASPVEPAAQDTAEQLASNILNRIKRRILKSVEAGKISLVEDNEAMIRNELQGLEIDSVLEQLNNMQEEISNVLPEQRLEIIKLWKPEITAMKILN